MHRIEIYCNFHYVTNTHLGYWLDAWTFHNVLNYLLVFIQSQLALLFMLIPMDPDQTRLAFPDYVHLVICAKFNSVLFQVELALYVDALVIVFLSFVEFVCETGT